jgi:RNA polymerase sigma-70 factor (ECF subfamily)
MSDLSDALLLSRFQDGDSAALETLLGRYEVSLYQFLFGLLRDHHLAEDALQETFVRALERLDAVDPDHLRGWLFTVAYHQAMLARRKEKRTRTAPLGAPVVRGGTRIEEVGDPQPGPLALAESGDDRLRLEALIAQLSPAQQEVVRQRGEGKRFIDIARALGCPLNTALARMHEALKRLRVLWGNEHV